MGLAWSIQRGLRESLAGRYELLRATHWTYFEAKSAFSVTLDEYLVYGGYPRVMEMREDKERALNYLRDSIYAPVLGKDLLTLKEIKKPSLLRQMFELVAMHPAQELSYRKMLGQLQDSGNSETAKHYLELLEAAFLIQRLEKYSGSAVSQISSSPKLVTLAPCFYTLFAGTPAKEDSRANGFVFEQFVAQTLSIHFVDLFYWRDGDYEMDFVVRHEGKVYGIEVKSGRRRREGGRNAFRKKYPRSKSCFVTRENVETFLMDPKKFVVESSV